MKICPKRDRERKGGGTRNNNDDDGDDRANFFGASARTECKAAQFSLINLSLTLA